MYSGNANTPFEKNKTAKEKIVMPFHEIETAFRRSVTILGILL